MKSTLKNLLTVMSVVSAILVVALLVLLVVGLRPYILESSSMEPTVTKGSLVFVKHNEVSEVKDGDVVVYRTNGQLVLHRYIGENRIQGDANSLAQSITLTDSNYVGTLSFSIPGIGFFVSFLLQQKWILWVLILSFVILACRPEKKVAEST